VFDKTGTLTHDRLAVSSVAVRPGSSETEALALAAALAAGSLHPVSRGIVLAAAEQGAGGVAPELTSLLEHAGQGMQADRIGGGWVKLGSAAFCGLSAERADEADDLAPRAHLADERGWLATIHLKEGVRADAKDAVDALRALGVQTWLLSGDRPAAAQQVAQAVGVDHVIAGASPEQKLAEVIALQGCGLRLAMVGDGLNDGPVLARADTSFALGHAAPLAQAQSDYVIQGGRVMDVVHTLTLARDTMRIVRQNLMWAAGYNAVCVPLALLGYMPPWLAGLGMAGSSLLVILNALRLAGKLPAQHADDAGTPPVLA
jgi:Cu2+-exporting ATPase